MMVLYLPMQYKEIHHLFLQSSNPWELNIISTDVFLNNNYGYISKQNVLGVLGEKDFVVNDDKSSPDLPKNTIGFGVYKKEYLEMRSVGTLYV